MIAVGQRLGVVGRDQQAGLAVLDHLGDAADIGRDDRARQGHRLEDRQALRLAVRRQDGDVQRGGHGRHVVATAGEHDPVGDPQFAGLRFERVAPAALADDQEVRVRDGAQHLGPGLQQRGMALLGLQPGDDTDDLRAGFHAVLVGERAARLLVVVPVEVHAVVDERDRGRVAALVEELAFDGPRDRDELVHVRRELAQDVLVRLVPDAAGVDRADEVRPAMADLLEGQDGPRGDGLGAVHVGVDDVRPDLAQVRGQRADGDRVVHLVDDEDGDAGPLELADGTPRRQRHDRDVVAIVVHPGHQRVEMLLGATVRAGREDLDDADAVATRQRRSGDRLEAGIVGGGG